MRNRLRVDKLLYPNMLYFGRLLQQNFHDRAETKADRKGWFEKLSLPYFGPETRIRAQLERLAWDEQSESKGCEVGPSRSLKTILPCGLQPERPQYYLFLLAANRFSLQRAFHQHHFDFSQTRGEGILPIEMTGP